MWRRDDHSVSAAGADPAEHFVGPHRFGNPRRAIRFFDCRRTTRHAISHWPASIAIAANMIMPMFAAPP